MKNFYLLLLALSLGTLNVTSQVLLNENFEAVTALPTGWVNIKVDNGTAVSNVSILNNGWQIVSIASQDIPGNSKAAASTSWFTNSSITADRWIISPPFTPSVNKTYLSFDIWSLSSSYLEAYEVYISPTGGNTVSDFSDMIFSTNSAPATITKKIFDLTNYVGQTISFAIRHKSKDKTVLFLDNILVEKPTNSYYTKMKALPNTIYFSNNENYNFKVGFSNTGADTIKNAKIHYQIDANTPVTETISSISVAYYGSRNHTFSTPYTTTGAGMHTVKFWLTEINGGSNKSIDTISYNFYVASQSVTRRPVIEHFTNTSCGPCAAQNPAFKVLMNQFPNQLSSIKYHPDFPGPNDPFYLFNKTENLARLDYYHINGVPTAVADGGVYKELPMDYNTAVINNILARKSFMDIGIVAQNVTDRDIDITVEVKPYINSGSENVVLHVVVVEDITTATPPGSNGEKDFPQVMRKMLPNQNGTTITGFTDGTTITKTFTYTADPSIDISKTHVVVFVQHVESQYVFQSEQVSVDLLNTVKESNVNEFTLYPNPAKDFTNLSFDLKNNSDVEIAISTIDGKIISTQNFGKLNAGMQNIQLNTANLSTGIYFISIKNEFGISTSKLIVE